MNPPFSDACPRCGKMWKQEQRELTQSRSFGFFWYLIPVSFAHQNSSEEDVWEDIFFNYAVLLAISLFEIGAILMTQST